MNEKILSILADGEFHSGDELGDLLGISRAAVWKRIQKVEALGLPLISVKGKGYCVEGGLDLLSKSAVNAHLDAGVSELISQLDLMSVIPSTNQLAMQNALLGRAGYVCAAEQQLAGRGRRGRPWVSPYAANIYVSVVWEFAGGANALEGLSLAIGVAVASALIRLGVVGVQLKWPNDVLHGDRKLAGVLIEMAGDAAGPCQVVVGIGVNVAMPTTAGRGIDQPWTDIQSVTGEKVNRSQFLALLLNEVMPLLSGFEMKGFDYYRKRWQQLDAYCGRQVFVRLGDSVEFGTASGVDKSGAIVVDTAAGRRLFSGGEVSLRGAD